MSFIDFKNYVNNDYHLPQLMRERSDDEVMVLEYADELHALFCEGAHEGENTGVICDWDTEENNSQDPWMLPAHNNWVNISKSFIAKNIDADMAWDVFNIVYFNGQLP